MSERKFDIFCSQIYEAVKQKLISDIDFRNTLHPVSGEPTVINIDNFQDANLQDLCITVKIRELFNNLDKVSKAAIV